MGDEMTFDDLPIGAVFRLIRGPYREIYVKLSDKWVLKKGNVNRTRVGGWVGSGPITMLGTLDEAMTALDSLESAPPSSEPESFLRGVWYPWNPEAPGAEEGPFWVGDNEKVVVELRSGEKEHGTRVKRDWSWGSDFTSRDNQIIAYKVIE